MNENKKVKHPWSGFHARYSAWTSERFKQKLLDFRERLYAGIDTEVTKELSEISITCSTRGMRCDWMLLNDETPAQTLIQPATGSPFFLDHAQKRIIDGSTVGTSRHQDRSARVNYTERHAVHKHGPCEVVELQLAADGSFEGPLHFRIWNLKRNDIKAKQMTSWWNAILPHLGNKVDGLGLAAKIELFVGEAYNPEFVLDLVELESIRLAITAFTPPAGYAHLDQKPHTRRFDVEPSTGNTSVTSDDDSVRVLASSAAPLHAFNMLNSENVRLVFDDRVFTRIEQLINRVGGNLESISGTGFKFDMTKILDDLPLNPPSNILGYVARRVGYALLLERTKAIHSQETRDGVADANRLANRLNDPRFQHPWRRFFDSLESDEQTELLELLTPPANDGVRLERLARPLYDFSETSVRFRLGDKYLRAEFGELDLSPQAHLTQKDGDDTGWRYKDGFPEFIKDGVADLMDVTLSAWELEFTFGGNPLLDPFELVEPSPATRLILPDFSIGLRTRLRLQQFDLDFEVSTTPTHSAAAAILLFTCPLCWAALYQHGFISATVEDLAIPIVVYLEQSPDRTAPPRLKVSVGSVEHSDVDFTIISFGFFPQLQVLISVLGSIVGDFVVPTVMENLHEKIQRQFNELLGNLPSIRLQDLCRLDWEYLRKHLFETLEQREKDLADANKQLTIATTIFRQAAEQANVDPDAPHSTLINSVVYTEYKSMLAAEEETRIAERRLETVLADIERVKNSPSPGMTVAGGYSTKSEGYHVVLSGVGEPMLGSSVLDYPPDDDALDADVALLMSNDYFKRSLGDLRFAANYTGELESSPGKEVDFWQEAPDSESMGPKPSNLQAGPPNVIMACSNIHNIPDWWGLAALVFVSLKEIRVLPVVDEAPGKPIAELIFRASVRADTAHHVPVAYEICEDVTHILTRAGELERGRPDLRLMGIEVDGEVRRVNDPHEHWFSGTMGRDIADRRVRFIYGSGGDAEYDLPGPRGSRPPSGGRWPPDGDDGNLPPIPGEDEIPWGYRPAPEDDIPPSSLGGFLCECRVGWDAPERETWLTAAAEARVLVHTGIASTLNLTDTSTYEFLPLIGYRLNANSFSPVGELTLEARGGLAGLQSPANSAWLHNVLLQQIRRRLPPSGGNDLKYLYGDKSINRLDPEDFTPAMALALNPNVALEPFAGDDFRPPFITLRTFGSDPKRLNVAVRMHILENFLQRL